MSAAENQIAELPPLSRDRSFWGMTTTQFLGAFNDNLFKQLILLLCVDLAINTESKIDKYQPVAQALFAIPFVLFSGFAGFVSDRNSKRRIVVLCKIAEIGVMLAGMVVFLTGRMGSPASLYWLFAVLFVMGTQSAFFGPAKYGILPEMLRERDLPAANGVIQMTTFLAIIFGMSAAGYAKEALEDRLWVVNAICVGIAVAGTWTSLFVRKTPIAHPGLRFDVSAIGVNRETWRLLRQDRTLFGVLMVSSLFWFMGGLVLPTVNDFGKRQIEIGDSRTSIMASCMGIGIAFGCVLAGKLSKKQVRFGLVKIGAWGIVVGFGAMAALGVSGLPVNQIEWLARLALTSTGVAAGLFVVPLQVFLQARPPEDQKGRMIGTMNLINWIGILASAGFYFVCTSFLDRASWTFAVAGLLLLPVALFYRPSADGPA